MLYRVEFLRLDYKLSKLVEADDQIEAIHKMASRLRQENQTNSQFIRQMASITIDEVKQEEIIR